MLRKLTLLLIAAAAFSQTTQVAPKKPQKPYAVAEAYKVYAAVLAQHPPEGELMIAEATVAFGDCQDSHSDKAIAPAILPIIKKQIRQIGACKRNSSLSGVTNCFRQRE